MPITEELTNLPNLITEPITLTQPADLNPKSSVEENIANDIHFANNVLKALHLAWSSVRSIGGVCKLADTTMNTLEKRRKLMLHPYGAESNSSKGSVVYPLD